MRTAPPATVRLAELVALLSLGTDLGFGQPMEHVIRQCLIALRLADRLEMDADERQVLYYAALLAWVGCHTDAYEQAKWFGNDVWIRRDAAFRYDRGSRADAFTFVSRHLGGAGRLLLTRARVGAAFAIGGFRDFASMYENHYLAADALAERLGLGDDVRESLSQSFERWDGKGLCKLRGAAATRASRLVNLADVVEVFQRTGGVRAAIAVARERAGTQFDPDLVDLFCREARTLFADLAPDAGWDDVIAAEPSLGQRLTGAAFDGALEAIADFTDLKSPYTLGHSRGVATLAAGAAAVAEVSRTGTPPVQPSGRVDRARGRRARWCTVQAGRRRRSPCSRETPRPFRTGRAGA